MVYNEYQELLRDIGKVWDQSKSQRNESKDLLSTIHEQYLQSSLFLCNQEKVHNQIIEELFEVTNQLIQNKLGGLAMITHSNEIEREIYLLERELQTAIMNDRDWDIDRLKNEISELEAELERQYN